MNEPALYPFRWKVRGEALKVSGDCSRIARQAFFLTMTPFFHILHSRLRTW